MGEDVPVTERWGRDPALCVFTASLHLFLINPVQGEILQNESSSQTRVMRVRDGEGSYAGKLMIGLVDLKKQLKKR